MRTIVPEHLERGRLVYERLRLAHASELGPLLLDAHVYRTLHPGPAPTAADVRAHAQVKEEHWERHGFGYWLLRDRGTGVMVGRGGLQHTHVEGAEAVEIGWAIVADRWGQGLATELAQTSIELGFGSLELAELVAYTLPDNVASRRVMEKTGFAYQRDIVHADLPHVLYVRRRGPNEP